MAEETVNEDRILRTWRCNAAPWTEAVRERRIASRREVTDAAIVDAVMNRAPRTVLDVGCGEGWLARALAQRDVSVLGVDVVPELVAAAQRAGGGEFRVLPYEALTPEAVGTRADVAVCNFSLLGETSVQAVFAAVPRLLTAGGAFIVQTLHPLAACGDAPYRDGWREGSWAGFGPEFSDPAPWYFRTLESWEALFAANGMRIVEFREPTYPESGGAVSAIFVAVAKSVGR